MHPKEMEWMPDWANALQEGQLKTVDALCRQVEGNTFIDVGCFIGGFSKVLATVAKERDGKVYSIDLFNDSKEPVALWGMHKDFDTKEIFTRHMTERGLIDYVKIIQGCSWEVASQFDDESVDFIYIDAEHKYESCKKDITAWFPKLKYGGIIAGHDYEYTTYDEQYINEDGHGDRHHGVIKAVNEFFKEVQFNNTIWSYRKEQK